MPTYRDFKTRWQAAYERWRGVRRKARQAHQLANLSTGDSRITTMQVATAGSRFLHKDGLSVPTNADAPNQVLRSRYTAPAVLDVKPHQ